MTGSTIDEQRRLARLLRVLCEGQLGDDGMICHDGGFRYGGDFMSMESVLDSDVDVLSEADCRTLLQSGYLEAYEDETGRSGGLRVTERGRHFAYRDDLS